MHSEHRLAIVELVEEFLPNCAKQFLAAFKVQDYSQLILSLFYSAFCLKQEIFHRKNIVSENGLVVGGGAMEQNIFRVRTSWGNRNCIYSVGGATK